MWKSRGKQSAGPSLLHGAASAIIENVRSIQAACGIDRVFLAVDFMGHGSTSITYTDDVREALALAYTAVVAALDAVVFEPEKDFKSAAASGNSMGVAAAEMTILARSTQFYPVVHGGQFVLKVLDEHRRPRMVGSAPTGGVPPKCGAVLRTARSNPDQNAEKDKAGKACKKTFGKRAVCPIVTLKPVG